MLEKDLLAKLEISEFSRCDLDLLETVGGTLRGPQINVLGYCEFGAVTTQSVVPIIPRNTREVHEDVVHKDFSRAKCAQPCDEGVVIFRTVPRNQQVCSAELEHKKAFDELSDAKNEEIAASNQQHKERSLEEQETKLSNDRNTTELKRT